MPRFDQTTVRDLFFATWVILAIAWIAFNVLASPATKAVAAKVLPSVAGVAFVSFTFLMSGLGAVGFVLIPVVLITLLNTLAVKVCRDCGRTNRSAFLYPPPAFCQKCGAALRRAAK